jgi:hypothetical protein
MIEYDNNKQGRPHDRKAGDRTIYPIHIYRFLQNTRRWSLSAGKNQRFVRWRHHICIISFSFFISLLWRHTFYLYLLSFCMITHMFPLSKVQVHSISFSFFLYDSRVLWSMMIIPPSSSKVFLLHVRIYIYPLIFHNKQVYITVTNSQVSDLLLASGSTTFTDSIANGQTSPYRPAV